MHPSQPPGPVAYHDVSRHVMTIYDLTRRAKRDLHGVPDKAFSDSETPSAANRRQADVLATTYDVCWRRRGHHEGRSFETNSHLTSQLAGGEQVSHT